jgi:hypothetical protein
VRARLRSGWGIWRAESGQDDRGIWPIDR